VRHWLYLKTTKSVSVLGLVAVLATILSAAVRADEYLVNELFYSESDPSVNTRTSEHFRIVWGNEDATGLMTEEYVQGNLGMFEDCWNRYIVEMAFPEPTQSTQPELRDGHKYKVNIIVGGTGLEHHKGGGAFMGYHSGRGFGYVICSPEYMRYDPPSGATPHEFAHVCQVHAGGGFTNNPATGFWWEAHANWMMLQFLEDYPTVQLINQRSTYYQGSGKHYYDNWQIFEYFKDSPEYGVEFVNLLWTDSLPGEYILDAMVRLDTSGSADKELAIRDAWGHMAKRNVTWDYARQVTFQAQDNHADKYRMGRQVLQRVSAQPGWYRIPADMAPQQMGYNIIPLELVDRSGAVHQVSVDFRGYVDPIRGSDWRACFVAVSDSGNTRYGRLWNNAVNSITLSGDENELYLVVIATPRVMPIVAEDDYRSRQKAQFPFKVSFQGALPYDLIPSHAGTPGHAHRNGGGFVATTAYAAATAYVGPSAQVLGNARVYGYARIEDYAIVEENAVVRDFAVVSGHAHITGRARIENYAKVRDFAKVHDSCIVRDNAKLLQHATIYGQCVLSQDAVMKGFSHAWGDSAISGNAIIDGDYANGLSPSKGVWFLWFVNTQQMMDDAKDLEHLYANYTFENAHPYLAWDTYGVTHGYLEGEPEIIVDDDPVRGGILALNGIDQYVDLPDDVSDMTDFAFSAWIKWTGGSDRQKIFQFGDGGDKWMYLTPNDGSGKLGFVITNNGESEQRILQGPAPLAADKWVHVAIVLEGDVARLYVDGVSLNETAISIDPDQLRGPNTYNGGCDNFLGRGYEGDSFFAGRLDDVRIYSRALSPPEISQIYDHLIDYTALVDLDATDLAVGTLLAWANSGSLAGSFGRQGTNPRVNVVSGRKAVTFDGNDKMASTFVAPEGITGNGDYTVAVWAHNPSFASEECMVAWGRRGGPDGSNAQFNFGDHPIWGAVGHWGWPDMGFSGGQPSPNQWHHITVTFDGQTEKVYVDGVLNATELKTLNIHPGNRVYLGCADGNTMWFTGSIASVQIYDVALPERMIRELAGMESEADTEPPTPDPPVFSIVPYALSETEISMAVVEGSDASGIVEYYFEEISGNLGGDDSGWQHFRNYVDTGLWPGTVYSYRVRMRDSYGNVTYTSERLSVRTMGTSLLPGDMNNDGCVDMSDFGRFAVRWKQSDCGTCGGADLDRDNRVDLRDLMILALNWLGGCAGD